MPDEMKPDEMKPDEMKPDEVTSDETTGTAPPRFRLGRLVATTCAMAAVISAGVSPQSLLARHMRGDWGDLCEEDRA